MQGPDHHCRVLASPWPGVYAAWTRSGRHFGRHSHGTFGVGVLQTGAQRSASGRGVVDAFAGDLVATNPGGVHDGRPLAGPDRQWFTVYLEPEVLQAHGARQADDMRITHPVLQDAELRSALQALLQLLANWPAPTVPKLALDEALANACGQLLARHATQPVLAARVDPALSRVRDCLADRLADPPALDELAALAGTGKYSLLRAFKRTFGVPPHAWLVQQRAERARGLVARGLSLADAAHAAGFADQSHMTRQFTRQFGFTPAAWRRAA